MLVRIFLQFFHNTRPHHGLSYKLRNLWFFDWADSARAFWCESEIHSRHSWSMTWPYRHNHQQPASTQESYTHRFDPANWSRICHCIIRRTCNIKQKVRATEWSDLLLEPGNEIGRSTSCTVFKKGINLLRGRCPSSPPKLMSKFFVWMRTKSRGLDAEYWWYYATNNRELVCWELTQCMALFRKDWSTHISW